MNNILNLKANLHFLIEYMKDFKVNFLNFYCGMLVQAIIEILGPVVLGFIINEIVYYKNMDTFIVLCSLYCFMLIFQCINYFLIYSNHHYLNSMYVLKIRDELFNRIVYGQSQYLANMNAGEMMTVMDEYTDDCLHFVVRNFIHFINNILVMIWCVYFLLKLDVRFGLFLFVILLLQIAITLKVNKKISNLSVERVSLFGEHISFISSILNALKDIQILTAEFFILKIYKEKYWDHREKDYKIRMENYKLEKSVEGLHTILLLFIYIFFMFQTLNSHILFGTFLTVITYFEAIRGKSLYVISLLSNFNDNLSKIDQVRRIFMLKTEKEIGWGNEKVNEIEGNIRFCNCSFSYDKKPVLNKVSFEIKQGEKVAVVGESGTGKSTILYLLTGLYSPNEGRIEIDKKNIQDMDILSLRKNISVVNQEIFILNDTIKNNLLLVNKNASEADLENVLEISQLKEFVDTLPDGIDTLLERDGRNLSGGQKQRIAVARAFLKDSKIILLDEATSALDPDTEMKIKNAISTSQKTMLIVSHRFSTISNCDKVIVLKGGMVAEIGNPFGLLEQKGVFYRLFREYI